MKCHPELKVKQSQVLEQCRTSALNPAAIKGLYNMLNELVTEFNIPPENIYNMDEKGVQLGVGGSVTTIIDRDMCVSPSN
jgi:hypothetical protein